MTDATAAPAWLPLLLKPYENILGSRTSWDLSMPDGTPVHIERANQGVGNALYRVKTGRQTYTCKLFLVDERRRVEREWAALLALHAAGTDLAPEPIACAPDSPLPQPVIVTASVEGAPLAGRPLAGGDLTRLVAAIARIHLVRPAPGTDFLPAWHQPAGYASYLAEAQEFMVAVRAWMAGEGANAGDLPVWIAALPGRLPLLEQVLSDAERQVAAAHDAGTCPVPGLIRMDGSLDKVLCQSDGSLMFVDWEYSGWGDAAFDLAELRWHPRSLCVSQADWDAALATYPAPHGDPGFAERLALYSRLLPAWWVARSALHLVEGVGQAQRKRLARLPARVFRGLAGQLDGYLAALGLIEPESDDEDGDD